MNKKESFESAINKLENIVLKLEKGDGSLDESLELFKEGTDLVHFCGNELKNAEQKITELSGYSKVRELIDE